MCVLKENGRIRNHRAPCTVWMVHLGTSASRLGTRITPTFFASRPTPTPQLYNVLFASRIRWAWRVRNGPAPLLGQHALWPGAEGACPSGCSPETSSAGRWPRPPSDAPWRRDTWAPGAGAQAWQCQGYNCTVRSSDDHCVTVASAWVCRGRLALPAAGTPQQLQECP